MSEERLNDLLSAWQEQRLHGRDLPAAELCRDCPELIPELELRIRAVRHMNNLVQPGDATASYHPSETQPETVAAPRSLPSVPGYEVMGELGRGGMGVVYRARHLALKRTVALKMILAGDFAGAAEIARFRTEAELAARLQHPNIVQIHEVGEVDGHPYCALEYVDGGSLAHKLAGQPLPVREAARLVEALAQAMHLAHSRNVVHRDLKPGNVLLTPAGTPKVTDFGLARQLNADSGRTASGAVLGTPSYMAPEQASGETRAAGPTADVYALGAILYECLTGRPPFRGATLMATLEQVRHAEPVAPRQVRPEVPRDLETVCSKCLRKEPERRYSSAKELADDLGRFLRGEPVQARPVGAWVRTAKWARRKPAAAALVAVSVVATMLLVGGTIWFAEQLRHERDDLRAANRKRVDALVDQLQTADAQAVPNILENLKPVRAEILPRLRELWDEETALAKRPRRMRVGLAMLADDAERVKPELAAWLLETDDPQEARVTRDELGPFARDLTPELWNRVADNATTPPTAVRTLAALALFDPQSEHWKTAGEEAADHLVSANSLHLGVWTDLFRPVRTDLVPRLSTVFRDPQRPLERQVAATVLADYLKDEPAALAELLLDADSSQYAVLFPIFAKHGQDAVRLMAREVDRTPEPPKWPDAELQSSWAGVDAAGKKKIESAAGVLTERFAFCQTLPLGEFEALARDLARSGYRPVRLRPCATLDGIKAAAVWTRDGCPWEMCTGATAAEVTQRQDQLDKNYIPVDVAGYAPVSNGQPTTPRFSALWAQRQGDEAAAELHVGQSTQQYQQRYADSVKDESAGKGYRYYATLNVARGPDKNLAFSWIWRHGDTETTPYVGSPISAADGGYPGHLQTDVHVTNPGNAQTYEGLLYAAAWRLSADIESVELSGLPPEEHARRCQQLAERGYRPAAITVATLGDGKTLVSASVWHRLLVPEAAKDTAARRRATAATTLLRLGVEEPAWRLLRHQEDPRLRSYLIHAFAPLGVDSPSLVRRLAREQDTSARRALVLSLGEYKPAADAELVTRLETMFRDEPDAGLHSATGWLLRVWGNGELVRKTDHSAQGNRKGEKQWYVNGQGQTMIVLPGPVEFMMGVPGPEKEGKNDFAPWHRQHIDRSFTICATEVTVNQFREFQQSYESTYFAPEPECPVNGVSWYRAAAYCNWLSEREGIPRDQWCYVDALFQEPQSAAAAVALLNPVGAPGLTGAALAAKGYMPPAKGMTLPKDHLSRAGYRLPTEAEWEYACRANSTTKRFYGNSEDLLPKYAHGRMPVVDRTWPVGRLKPNDFGLFDVLGNSPEWCHDAWPRGPSTDQFLPYGLEPGKPSLDKEGALYVAGWQERVIRGGSAGDAPGKILSNLRDNAGPDFDGLAIGFRVARTVR
jgi:formylglycine-generating enzyme required for sulfatase activity